MNLAAMNGCISPEAEIVIVNVWLLVTAFCLGGLVGTWFASRNDDRARESRCEEIASDLERAAETCSSAARLVSQPSPTSVAELRYAARILRLAATPSGLQSLGNAATTEADRLGEALREMKAESQR